MYASSQQRRISVDKLTSSQQEALRHRLERPKTCRVRATHAPNLSMQCSTPVKQQLWLCEPHLAVSLTREKLQRGFQSQIKDSQRSDGVQLARHCQTHTGLMEGIVSLSQQLWRRANKVQGKLSRLVLIGSKVLSRLSIKHWE